MTIIEITIAVIFALIGFMSGILLNNREVINLQKYIADLQERHKKDWFNAHAQYTRLAINYELYAENQEKIKNKILDFLPK